MLKVQGHALDTVFNNEDANLAASLGLQRVVATSVTPEAKPGLQQQKIGRHLEGAQCCPPQQTSVPLPPNGRAQSSSRVMMPTQGSSWAFKSQYNAQGAAHC